MKKIVIAGIVGMVLISFVSAGLVDFLSNSVSGSVEVLGPVFYTASGERLFMNDDSNNHGYGIIIEDVDSKVFWMEEGLGGLDFNYIPKLMFHVNISANNVTIKRGLGFEFGYSKSNGGSHTICFIEHLNLVDSEEYKDYEIPCDGSEVFLDVDKFYYKIIGKGSPDIEYTLKTKGTYVEITGVVQ